jgi:tetratricopeptide (TPR) repeat protein
MKDVDVMKKILASVQVMSAFIMSLSSAAIAAEDMLPSEYYNKSVLEQDSGVYKYKDKLIVHSKVAIESKRPSSKNKAMAKATLGTVQLIRRWAIKYTEKNRKCAETLTDGEQYIKRLLDNIDSYWQFPDWNMSVPLQSLKDGRDSDFYIVGLCGDREAVVAAIPPEYRRPCDRNRLKEAVKNVSNRFMRGSRTHAFFRECGVWDLADCKNIKTESSLEFKAVNADIDTYLKESSLAKELEEEVRKLSIPQVVTNVTREMNPQGTTLIETKTVVTTVSIPRMQKLFLNQLTETNYPTVRLPSGTAAIAMIRNSKIPLEEKAKMFRQALCESPGDKALWNFYGRILMKKGDDLGSIICFRNALKLDNRFVYPIINLSVAYKKLGKQKLSIGLAIVASGLATDVWSLNEINKILWNISDDNVAGRSVVSAEGKATVSKNKESTKKNGVIKVQAKEPPKEVHHKTQSLKDGFSSSEVNRELDF